MKTQGSKHPLSPRHQSTWSSCRHREIGINSSSYSTLRPKILLEKGEDFIEIFYDFINNFPDEFNESKDKAHEVLANLDMKEEKKILEKFKVMAAKYKKNISRYERDKNSDVRGLLNRKFDECKFSEKILAGRREDSVKLVKYIIVFYIELLEKLELNNIKESLSPLDLLSFMLVMIQK